MCYSVSVTGTNPSESLQRGFILVWSQRLSPWWAGSIALRTGQSITVENTPTINDQWTQREERRVLRKGFLLLLLLSIEWVHPCKYASSTLLLSPSTVRTHPVPSPESVHSEDAFLALSWDHSQWGCIPTPHRCCHQEECPHSSTHKYLPLS